MKKRLSKRKNGSGRRGKKTRMSKRNLEGSKKKVVEMMGRRGSKEKRKGGGQNVIQDFALQEKKKQGGGWLGRGGGELPREKSG